MIRAEWTTKPQIYRLIDDGAMSAAEGSLLIVCIMSHGSAGTLRSEDGDKSVLINDLIVRLTRNVQDNLPMVRTFTFILDQSKYVGVQSLKIFNKYHHNKACMTCLKVYRLLVVWFGFVC